MSASQPTISSISQFTGSYNWTHRAAHHNEENLVLTTGDPELARHFLREFARLTGQPDAPAADPAVQRALKRLAVIQSLLTLHETEDLPKHLDRLEAELLALEAERAEATRLLTAFELWHQRELGELLQEVLALRRDVARHQRHTSAYAESEYQRAHQRYQQQAHDREQAQAVAAHTRTWAWAAAPPSKSSTAKPPSSATPTA